MLKTLLIVDDKETNRKILKGILSQEYNFLEAANGREAIDVMERNHTIVSVVLLDLVMPVMNGFDVLSEMRRDPRLKSIPVIVTTVRNEEASEVKAFKMGANDYISKPYSPVIIRQRIRNVIDLRETVTEISGMRLDPLTGLYNRRAFMEKAEAMIAAKEPGHYVLACFDVNNFKMINDQYGTEKGDEVLRLLSDVFKKGLAKISGISSRIMADEFAVLYPCKYVGTEALANISRTAVTLDGSLPPLSVSIGRYVVSDLSLSTDAMYDRAVMAKETVKGCYDVSIAQFDESMRNELIAEHRIMNEMNSALENGQFEPWFQPQYNHATGQLIGAEALVRWKHPERGIMPPRVFIPVFEKNGFIYELDKNIWEQTCQCIRRWIDEGRDPLPLSVNISRFDIYRADLMNTISALIQKYDIPVGLLRLEITESAFSQSNDQVADIVKQLVDMGFTVEIDDFGSGYSSLNILKDVPAQIIKLDMKFLDAMDESPRGGNILESVIRMFKWLGMNVIAEGVETKKQADFLESLGSFYVQGYLYAKPMPLHEYEDLVASSKNQQHVMEIEAGENFDESAFWDPESMDTLIFNSYIGGACIYEYFNGKIELVRINGKYISVLGSTGMDVEAALKLDWAEYMDSDSLERIRDAVQAATENGEEKTTELLFLNLPGCAEKIYLRVAMRVIARAGSRYLVYCINENITEQRLAEQKIEQSNDQLVFLESIAHELLTQQDASEAISSILNRLLKYFDGDRAFVLEFDLERNVINVTFERCADGVSEEKIRMKDIPIDTAKAYIRAFEMQSYVYIPDIEAFDGDDYGRELLRAQDVRSLVGAPLKRNGEVVGIFGVDNPHGDTERIKGISVLGDYIEALLIRKQLNTAIDDENKEKMIMDGIPGGCVRMKMSSDGTIVPLYRSTGMQRLLGMDKEMMETSYGNSVMAGVHPDDREIVNQAVSIMVNSGEVNDVRYRLRKGDGEYTWVSIFGRARKAVSGEIFMNIYYTDAHERKRLADIQKELLDNLPCGAALYEFDGKKLSIVHLNRNYWEMVGRDRVDYSSITVTDRVHPDDRHRIGNVIAKAIREKNNAVCDVRIICGDGEYKLFHVVSKVLSHDNGNYTVYAAYTLTFDEAAAARKMLTGILFALMESTSDFAFAKDNDLRYICCSKNFIKMAGATDRNDVIGKTDYELFDRETADKFRRDDESVIESGEAKIDMIEDIPSTDETPHYSNTSKYLMRDSDGNILGLYGIGRDITETQDAFNWLKLVTSDKSGGIVTYEYSPDGGMKLLHFNDGFCGLFGISRAECIASGPEDFIFKEDMPKIVRQMDNLINDSSIAECTFRINVKHGGTKCVDFKANVARRKKDKVFINAILTDITEWQSMVDSLRLNEIGYSLAMRNMGNLVCRFIIANRTLTMTPEAAKRCDLPEKVGNMPYGMLRRGLIADESRQAYISFYSEIIHGGKHGSLIFRMKISGEFRWMKAVYSTVLSEEATVFAVISHTDVTEQLEKEVIYKKWQQSLQSRPPETYTLLRYNISRGVLVGTQEGNLLTARLGKEGDTFNECSAKYAEEYVYDSDRDTYLELMESDAMLAGYYRCKRHMTLDYREKTKDDGVRWLRLTVELVKYPNSSDIEAYLMFENIDSARKEELRIRLRADTDSLTGVLNRTVFEERMEAELSCGTCCAGQALMVLDIDNFKQLNDSYGHVIGDKALKEVVNAIVSSLRSCDLVGRLGGDEFLICICDITDRQAIASKANKFRTLIKEAEGFGDMLTASIGIAVCPDDGTDFSTLYRKADTALYHAKRNGRDKDEFYDASMGYVEPCR